MSYLTCPIIPGVALLDLIAVPSLIIIRLTHYRWSQLSDTLNLPTQGGWFAHYSGCGIEEGCVILRKGWCGSFKIVVWYFEKGDVVL